MVIDLTPFLSPAELEIHIPGTLLLMRGEKLRPFHDIVPLWQNCVFNFGNAQGEALKLQGLTERNNEVLLLPDYHKFEH